jgi:hypothetical protein
MLTRFEWESGADPCCQAAVEDDALAGIRPDGDRRVRLARDGAVNVLPMDAAAQVEAVLDSVLAIVDRSAAKLAGWDGEALSSLVSYLERRGQIDHLLRIYEQSDSLPASVRENLAQLFVDTPTERVTTLQMPDVAEFLTLSDQAHAYQEVSERFSHTADAESGLKMLQLLPALVPEEQAQRFYAREKRALGRLAGARGSPPRAARYRRPAVQSGVAVRAAAPPACAPTLWRGKSTGFALVRTHSRALVCLTV